MDSVNDEKHGLPPRQRASHVCDDLKLINTFVYGRPGKNSSSFLPTQKEFSATDSELHNDTETLRSRQLSSSHQRTMRKIQAQPCINTKPHALHLCHISHSDRPGRVGKTLPSPPLPYRDGHVNYNRCYVRHEVMHSHVALLLQPSFSISTIDAMCLFRRFAVLSQSTTSEEYPRASRRLITGTASPPRFRQSLYTPRWLGQYKQRATCVHIRRPSLALRK